MLLILVVDKFLVQVKFVSIFENTLLLVDKLGLARLAVDEFNFQTIALKLLLPFFEVLFSALVPSLFLKFKLDVLVPSGLTARHSGRLQGFANQLISVVFLAVERQTNEVSVCVGQALGIDH